MDIVGSNKFARGSWWSWSFVTAILQKFHYPSSFKHYTDNGIERVSSYLQIIVYFNINGYGLSEFA